MQTSCAHGSPSSRCSDNDAGSKDIQLQVQIIVNNAGCSLVDVGTPTIIA